MPGTSEQVQVRCEGASKSYGRREVLVDINLTVTRGESVGLVGPNGAGKTTLLSLIDGLRKPSSGTVRLFDGDPRDPRSRTWLGVAPQALSLPETAKVSEVIHYVRSFFREPARETELVEEFGIGDMLGKQVGGLSGGQKRLVSVALAFAGNPALVLLDEPTTGLDSEARTLLWSRVTARIDAGTTLLVTSHYVEDIERLARRVVVLDRGQITLDDTLGAIHSSASRSVVRVRTTEPERLAHVHRIGEVAYRLGLLEIVTDDVDATVNQVLGVTGSMRDLEIVNDSLAEVGRDRKDIA